MTYQLYSDDDLDFDGDKDEKDTKFFSGRDSVIFAIDCSKEILESNSNENNESFFTQIIGSVHDLLLNKIVVSEKDLQAVVLFGTDKKSNSSDFDNVYVLLDLSMPSIASITKLKKLRDISQEQFKKEYGIQPNYRVSDVLWETMNMFSNCKHKLAAKSVVLFTWDSHPHSNDSNATLRAKAKAGDLHDHKVQLQVYSFNPQFSYNPFYKEIVSNPEFVDGNMHPLGGVVNLYNLLVRETNKQRAVKKIPLKLGKFEISVGLYTQLRRATKSSSVNIDQKTNCETISRRSMVDENTGEILLPSDIKYLQKWGGVDIVFEKDEVQDMKSFGDIGLRVLGFKPISTAIKRWYHVRSAQFIYPDEERVKGSTSFFKALLNKCHKKMVVALCRFTAYERSSPRLVCLLPQIEKIDPHSRLQIKPPGFHLIYLPFSDDIRHIDICKDVSHQPQQDAVEVAQTFIHKMRFSYETESIDDPALQTHYKNLEAMALELPAPEPIIDFTKPDHDRIRRKAGSLVESFKSLVYTPDYNPEATTTTKTTSSAKPKSVKDTAQIDVEDYVRNKKLSSITVAGLKEICHRIGVRAPSKKAEIIERIENHYKSK